MKRILNIALALSISALATAQTASDALNLSSTKYGSTARSAALGGAFGALGGDFSSISINPAGLGVYRGGEFTFTPNLYMNKSTSNYLDLSSGDKRVGINFNNLGLVFATPTTKEQGIVSVNFAIGYNRLKDFNRTTFIKGDASDFSRTDDYAYDLNQFGEDNSLWESYLAFKGYLADELPSGGYKPILFEGVNVDQVESIMERGRIDEWDFALAFNISHKIYVGASIGIRDVFYTKDVSYSEVFGRNAFGDTYEILQDGNSIAYQDGGFGTEHSLSTTGYGFNAKIGVIARPIDALRLGLSIHTPTYYLLNDRYSYSVDPDILVPDGSFDIRPEIQNSDDISYDYILYSSPLNVELSMAYIIGKYGVFSLDYGINDYSGMTINERKQTTGEFSGTNQLISDVYGLGTTLRTGLELKASANFSLRGGYAQYNSGLKDKADAYAFNKPGALNQYSMGFGYRDNNFFMDFAYVMERQNVKHSLFILDDAEPVTNPRPKASIDYSSNKLMMTVGFRF